MQKLISLVGQRGSYVYIYVLLKTLLPVCMKLQLKVRQIYVALAETKYININFVMRLTLRASYIFSSKQSGNVLSVF